MLRSSGHEVPAKQDEANVKGRFVLCCACRLSVQNRRTHYNEN
jgi:hypothetical protein